MPDAIFEHPRLVAIYDALDPDRSDLVMYMDIAACLNVGSVLDLGSGTGTLALAFAGRGMQVTAADPAAGSLAVAQRKPDADKVRWLLGDGSTLPSLHVDLVTMTGNAAQAIVDQVEWDATLRGVYSALRPGGYFVFETRDPAAMAWQEWNRDASHRTTEIPGVGKVESWVDLIDVRHPLVSFRWSFLFVSDGDLIKSDSTLLFRERADVEAALASHGYVVEDVRGAPDRLGKEFVFIARRPV